MISLTFITYCVGKNVVKRKPIIAHASHNYSINYYNQVSHDGVQIFANLIIQRGKNK